MSEAMRVAVLHGVHDVRLEERPVPQPGPGEVLIQVRSVGTCGSDVHYYEHGRIGDFVVEQPLVLGHEPSGVVVARGSEARLHEVGQRVAIEPGVPCSVCAQCKAGRYNLCPRMRFFGTPPIDGAFCEYVVLREDFAHPVPDSLSDDAAGLLEPLSVGVWANRKARTAPGSRVLITGAGPIGLVATQTARAFGASEVVVTDVNPRRLEVAKELGATATVDVSEESLTDTDFDPDVLLECSGVPAAAGQAIRKVGRAGRIVLIGMGGDEIPLPLAHVQNFEIEVTGTFRYANTWPTAIALAAGGEVDLDRLVTHRFGLDQVEEALTVAAKDDTVIKAVVVP
ncbi:NAD(P)-dependent alcohol dehydrogenase [Amycolatopsis acidiphila]|uniref:NAD(P)-dependent alcohol dehydrogenase n=2 Tax=Amycolatopsis acidiphila TaxID=715473 RepID=A0A557ZRJ4_9PSEU|nr:NAD(P)-dependent alcohol dehydrogenase [Amycolatopsis acidiphila]TVT14643.1 NAD(P)-dependent alcohol dehydrogenase [Amycolatopsis acidiphila]UIJ60738.1 NAD(P)-dependent alcohol dehydrogenase [Amycolatopsis acidiphila]